MQVTVFVQLVQPVPWDVVDVDFMEGVLSRATAGCDFDRQCLEGDMGSLPH